MEHKLEAIEFEEYIPLKSKWAFGGTILANDILSGLGLGFITYYYNVVLGLNAALAGLAWIIFIIWNTCNDPLFGFIEDRTKSARYGRRIPYLRFGAPIYSVLFMLCWFPLVDVNNEIALFFNFVIILFAFDTIFTIIGLITYSLPAEMAVSSKARAGIMIFRSIFGSIGLLLTFFLPTLLLTGETAPSIEIFLTVMVIIGIVCGVIQFVSSYFIKENKYTQLEEPLGLWSSIKETLKNKPFLIFEASNFFFVVAQYILQSSIFYYIDYILDLEGIASLLPLGIFFGVIFAFTVVYNKLLGKYDLKDIYIGILLLCGFSFLLFFLIGWYLYTAIIGMVLLGIGFSGYYMTGNMVIADTIDFDEVRTRKRRETSYAGVNALITKPAVSIGPWLFLLILSLSGFDNRAIEQTSFARLGIMIGFTIIPAILILIAAIIITIFPLSGYEWNQKKLELHKIHQEKEQNYLKKLKEEGKI